MREDCCLFGHREISRTGCPLLRSVECTYHAYISCLFASLLPLRGWDVSTRGTLLSDLLPMYSALDPNYVHSPAEKEPSGDVCFLLKLLLALIFSYQNPNFVFKGRV